MIQIISNMRIIAKKILISNNNQPQRGCRNRGCKTAPENDQWKTPPEQLCPECIGFST